MLFETVEEHQQELELDAEVMVLMRSNLRERMTAAGIKFGNVGNADESSKQKQRPVSFTYDT